MVTPSNHRRYVKGLQEEIHAAGFDLRQVEDVVDERQQVFAGGLNLLEVRVKSSWPRSAASSCNISL